MAKLKMTWISKTWSFSGMKFFLANWETLRQVLIQTAMENFTNRLNFRFEWNQHILSSLLDTPKRFCSPHLPSLFRIFKQSAVWGKSWDWLLRLSRSPDLNNLRTFLKSLSHWKIPSTFLSPAEQYQLHSGYLSSSDLSGFLYWVIRSVHTARKKEKKKN